MEMQLTGANEIVKLLETLPLKVQEKILLNTLKRIARTEVAQPIRSALPYSSTVEGMVGVFNNKDRVLSIWAGVRAGKRSQEEPTQPPKGVILRFLEKGTKQRTTKGGANRGAISGSNKIPSLMQGYAANYVDEFNARFGEELAKMIEKETKKIKK